MYTGKAVFAPLMSLIPRRDFKASVAIYKGDYRRAVLQMDKQHLHIKSFYGTSENAVYTQIWIAICSFLILALAKKKMGIEQSLYSSPQTLGFE